MIPVNRKYNFKSLSAGQVGDRALLQEWFLVILCAGHS